MEGITFRLHPEVLHNMLEGPEGPVVQLLSSTAVRVERRAKHLCPVDTGRLRSSITHAVFREGDGLVAHVGTDVEYAVYVEFGTSRAGAQPFLRPALAAEKGVSFT